MKSLQMSLYINTGLCTIQSKLNRKMSLHLWIETNLLYTNESHTIRHSHLYNHGSGWQGACMEFGSTVSCEEKDICQVGNWNNLWGRSLLKPAPAWLELLPWPTSESVRYVQETCISYIGVMSWNLHVFLRNKSIHATTVYCMEQFIGCRL